MRPCFFRQSILRQRCLLKCISQTFRAAELCCSSSIANCYRSFFGSRSARESRIQWLKLSENAEEAIDCPRTWSATNIGADRDSEKRQRHAQTAGMLGKLSNANLAVSEASASGTTLVTASKTAFPIARTCFVSFIALVGPSTTSSRPRRRERGVSLGGSKRGCRLLRCCHGRASLST
jgi:hypothetical protein